VDASLHGQRFLMIKNVDVANSVRPSIIMVENWFEELKQLVPTE
jgi:hypothetical protein